MAKAYQSLDALALSVNRPWKTRTTSNRSSRSPGFLSYHQPHRCGDVNGSLACPLAQTTRMFISWTIRKWNGLFRGTPIFGSPYIYIHIHIHINVSMITWCIYYVQLEGFCQTFCASSSRGLWGNPQFGCWIFSHKNPKKWKTRSHEKSHEDLPVPNELPDKSHTISISCPYNPRIIPIQSPYKPHINPI